MSYDFTLHSSRVDDDTKKLVALLCEDDLPDDGRGRRRRRGRRSSLVFPRRQRGSDPAAAGMNRDVFLRSLKVVRASFYVIICKLSSAYATVAEGYRVCNSIASSRETNLALSAISLIEYACCCGNGMRFNSRQRGPH